ncbi:MAG: glycosyltransferase family 4 protein, partial [Bacillota bacterium]|nr:glycosyltransferase family 4 protein [Bacillota bacterium]
KENGNTIELASNFIHPLKRPIREFGFKEHNVPFTRKVFSKGNFKAFKILKNVISTGKYDIVHCHTPNASVITRLICRKYRKRGLKVYYTAHGFHFYKGAPKKNWVIYYVIEWICSFFTDVLITINKEDFNLASKKMKAKHVEYVPGIGINLEKFQSSKNESSKKIKTNAPNQLFLSVGELNENKNHAIVIKALALIKNSNIHYAIAGEGDHYTLLKKLAEELNLDNRVHLLGFRDDINELMNASNVYIFPSYREGLSVSLMEAMASGLPCVISSIRGNTDLIDENGGVSFNPASVKECKDAIEKILVSDVETMGKYNKRKVKNFTTNVVLDEMKRIYGL